MGKWPNRTGMDVEAGEIVADLASMDPITFHPEARCRFCRAVALTTPVHQDDCLWQRASRWCRRFG